MYLSIYLSMVVLITVRFETGISMSSTCLYQRTVKDEKRIKNKTACANRLLVA